jgi:hypothetical protein
MDIETLIKCKKSIINKQRPEFKQEYQHLRMNIKLNSSLKNHSMTMFLRKLKDSMNDFSIGLRLDTPHPYSDFQIVLARFQGPHGGQSDNSSFAGLHNAYHIHLYSQTDFERKRKKASVDSKIPANYSSFEEAVCEFLIYCNIDDPNGVFNIEQQMITQYRLNLP